MYLRTKVGDGGKCARCVATARNPRIPPIKPRSWRPEAAAGAFLGRPHAPPRLAMYLRADFIGPPSSFHGSGPQRAPPRTPLCRRIHQEYMHAKHEPALRHVESRVNTVLIFKG